MAKPHLLIPGGQGRIGRLLCKGWANQSNLPFDPVFLGRTDWNIGSGLPPILEKGDLVLDLAARTRGDVSANPETAKKIAEWAYRSSAMLFQMSSAAVYAGGDVPMREDDDPMPVSDYGRSKLESEKSAFSACPAAHIIRLGNVAGVDALLSGLRPDVSAVLDPVEGSDGGPIRSYIGPATLAATLSGLFRLAIKGHTLPGILNLAQPEPVSMASLLQAKGHAWSFGVPRPGVIAKVELSTHRLLGLVQVPKAVPEILVQEASAAGISK